MDYKKYITLFGCFIVGALLQTGYAQSNVNPINGSTVQAKIWSKDEAKQVQYSDWKNFTATTINDLTEFKTANSKLDKYGGLATIKTKAAGFYRTELLNGRWWVIDPVGHPISITAVNSIRLGKSDNNESAMSQQFGDKKNWITVTINTLQQLGFNTAGSWSDTAAIIEYNKNAAFPFAYTTQLNLLSGYAAAAKKKDKSRKNNSILSFLLDDGFAEYCKEQAKKLSVLKNDSNVLGHFSDNELPFTHTAFKDIVTVDDKTDKCYVAALQWMKEKEVDENTISKAQKEEFIGWLAGKYFETVSKAIKQYDPNHLFIGSRLHSSAKNNPHIFKAANAFVDIISINYYGEWQPKEDHIANWANWSSKPFFITEFYTKAEETGMSNLSGAGWIVKTQTDRGLHYQNFCLQLLKAKNCVGWHWFRYQDNDPADASADASNKDSNKGLVNTQYNVYEQLSQKMKEINNQKYSLINFLDQK